MEVKKLTRRALSILVTGMMCVLAYGQSRVSGTVTDATGYPVVGATVVVVGTNNYATTDLDGQYELANVAADASVEISFIGYTTQTIAVGGRAVVNVVLAEDQTVLEEVVVTGYGGKQLRSKLTNSIAKVSEETFTVGAYSNPAQALAGAVSGVKVTTSSGNPGSTPTIVLRGGTNLDGSGSPLVIVDGQLRGGLNDINPADIESMEFLKDAGSTAIYGARASNGVILITTKTGKSGHASISADIKAGLNYTNNPYKFLSARDYITMMRKAYQNTPWASKTGLEGNQAYGLGRTYSTNMSYNLLRKTADNAWLLDKGWEEMTDPITGDQIIFKDTNISDFAFNDPQLTQDYNISMQGGNDRGSYYAGLGYYHSDGVPVNTWYERYSFVFNGSYKINDFIKTTSNFNYNRANWESILATHNEAQYFGRMISQPPTSRWEDEDGNMLYGPSNGADSNPLFQPDKFDRDYQTDKFTMIQGVDIDITKNLRLHGSANWYLSEGFNEAFDHDYRNLNGWVTTRAASASYSRQFSQTYNATLNYNNTFADAHSINVLVGTEAYDQRDRGFSASGSGAPTDDFGDLQYTDSGEGKRNIDSNHSQYRILSYFGRMEYDYVGKYLLSATFRQDGYSSLLGNNRWGFFPGVSGGWVFSKEPFMQNFEWVSFGKLRASYGVNGNASGIGAYTLQGSYNSAKYGQNTGYLIGTLPNPGLRWEKSKTFEVGLDISFLQNRINANFTYYNRLTDDKYAAFSLPPTTGFSSVTNNNGQFRNRGVEIELSAHIIQNKDFKWDFSGNITYNKNIIVKLPETGVDGDRNRQGGTELYTGKGNETDWFGGYQEGQEPGVLIGYVAERMWRNASEIPSNYWVESGHWNGYWQYSPDLYNALENKGNAVLLEPGDIQWKDINGDGHIDSKDRVVIGNTVPHWTGGFNTTFNWKGLQLYARFDYALDYWIYDGISSWFMGCMQGVFNTLQESLDCYSPENPNGKWPRYVWADQFGAGNYYKTSTLFAYRGDYLALRELQLSYTLPKSWTDKIRCQKLALSVAGQNLGYLTAAPKANPEISSGSDYNGTASYGLPRTVLFGLNLTF